MANVLTEEIIRNATPYISISGKTILAKSVAEKCIETIEIKHHDEMLPPIYKENQSKRMQYGLYVLLSAYLHVIEPNVDEYTEKTYDEWCGTGILNQLNRFKTSKDTEIRDKAYDILDDYREFYRMVGGEINAMLSAKNDLLLRVLQYFDGKMSPEYFEQSLKDLRDVQNEALEYINNRDKMLEEA